MKIAIVYDVIYPYVIGGGEKRVYELARALSRKHEVHLFGMKFWDGEDVIKKDGIFLHGVCKNKNLYNRYSQRNIWEPLYFSYHLLRTLFKYDFDIIDCQNFPYFPCLVVKLYSLIKKKPMVITWLELWEGYWFKHLGLKGAAGLVIERLVLKLTKHNITISGYNREKLKKYGIDASVITPGFEIKRMRQIKKENKKFDVLFAGRLIKEKNMEVLLRAMSILGNRTCCIIGDGPEIGRLKELKEKLNLSNRVAFLGFLKEQEEVYAYMKSAKVFVTPSLREGFGTTVLESLICNTPVVVVDSKHSAAKSLVKSEFVCKNSEDEIAKKIKLIIDKGIRNYGDYSEYDLKMVAARLENEYAKIAKV